VDKIQFVRGMFPDDTHLNGVQNAAEEADKRLALAVAGQGIVAGFDLSISGNIATVSPGLGFDGLGRAVHSNDPVALDLSTITRPSSGQYKWVTIYAAFSRKKYGDVYDDNNQRHDLYQDESVTLGLVQGAVGSQSGAERPSVGTNILVADLLVDAITPYASITPSLTRRSKIATLLSLKTRDSVARVSIDVAAAKTVTFSSLGLPDGSYSVRAQLVGSAPFVRNLGVEVSGTGVTLYLYHDAFPYSSPVLGAPVIKVGAARVGTFKVGGLASVQVDLFIRKEDL
jgi:hypothetical protein